MKAIFEKSHSPPHPPPPSPTPLMRSNLVHVILCLFQPCFSLLCHMMTLMKLALHSPGQDYRPNFFRKSIAATFLTFCWFHYI